MDKSAQLQQRQRLSCNQACTIIPESFVVNLYQNCCHIVASHVSWIGSDVCVQDLGQYWRQLFCVEVLVDIRYLAQFCADEFQVVFVGLLIVNSITAHEYPLRVLVELYLCDVGLRRDQLLVPPQCLVLFIFQISDRARDIDASVDARIADEPSCFLNSLQLERSIWLVIKGGEANLVLFADDGARVACVRADQFVAIYQYHVGRAAGLAYLLLLQLLAGLLVHDLIVLCAGSRVIVLTLKWVLVLRELHFDICQLFLRLRGFKYLVHPVKVVDKSLLVVLCLEAIVLEKLLDEVILDKLRYLHASVSIEYPENLDLVRLSVHRVDYVCIFHLNSPSLHLAGTPDELNALCVGVHLPGKACLRCDRR